jgi:sugar/nucleoside kinase (ribokinase family)
MQRRPYDVLVVGELNVDIVVTGDVVPEFGQVEKLVDDLAVCAGSSAGIFAASASRMGLCVLFASRVGDDLFGRYLLDALRSARVDPSHVVVDPGVKTGSCIQLLRGDDRAMLTHLGSIAAITAADINPAWYGQARHLHVASPFLLTGLRPAMPEMMRRAKAAGMTVSLDTNWDPSGKWALKGFFDVLDVFLPNENEVRAISGEEDIEKAMVRMARRVPVLVVKRGAAGATVFRGTERVDVPAFPVRVVDTTGAGDSFDGGFLAGWLRGEALRQCLLLGSTCGGLTTTRPGGFNGQPTWDEALAFIGANLAPGRTRC